MGNLRGDGFAERGLVGGRYGYGRAECGDDRRKGVADASEGLRGGGTSAYGAGGPERLYHCICTDVGGKGLVVEQEACRIVDGCHHLAWSAVGLPEIENEVAGRVDVALDEAAREAGKTRGVALAEGGNIFHGHCAFEQGQKQHVGHNAVGHGLMEVCPQSGDATAEKALVEERGHGRHIVFNRARQSARSFDDLQQAFRGGAAEQAVEDIEVADNCFGRQVTTQQIEGPVGQQCRGYGVGIKMAGAGKSPEIGNRAAVA